MGDLISRKYVVKELLKEREHFPPMVAERYSFGVKLPHRFNQAMRGGIRKALRIAETAPTIDAEPVRHGRWIEDIAIDYKAYPPYEYKRGYKCSLCGREERTNKEPYCHCGAKMWKGKQENESD